MMNWFEKGNIEEITLFEAMEATRSGIIRLPIYQRDAVWSEERICSLWDSLLRGFPLPSFLLVKGKGKSRRLQSNYLDRRKKIEQDEAQEYFDLLDGQQRMAAIDSICSYTNQSNDLLLRLWLDLAPNTDNHPFKFKYWIHACNKVFPFGFSIEASGEHEFAVLEDKETNNIWNKLQSYPEMAGKEFYQLSLNETVPYKAGCPIPLDKLLKLLDNENQPTIKELVESIKTLASSEIKDKKEFLKEYRNPVDKVLFEVASGLMRLKKYKIAIQLINDIADDYVYFERIGRGGIQITQRQLAVSKIMLKLGKEGNDAVASFQSSDKLHHLLDTEDIIHAIARVAFAVTDKGGLNDDETEERRNNRDLIELTPERLNVIEKDGNRWAEFIDKIKNYCSPNSGGPNKTEIEQIFENLYKDIKYNNKNNPNGFSLVQLAQPDKGEGISPITLHPLLYWYATCSKGETPTPEHRDDMIRWLLFSNGILSKPKHLQLNREVFRAVRHAQHVKFSEITKLIFSAGNENLRRDVGLSWQWPAYDTEKQEITFKEEIADRIPNPETMTCLTARRLLLQNWSESKISRFVLLWNQRELMNHLYDDIKYRPALFSKGRPFDADHIVARKRLLHPNGTNISPQNIRESIAKTVSFCEGFPPVSSLKDEHLIESIRLTVDCFRKIFPWSIANYRYWPRRLNRHDHDKSVSEKMNIYKIIEALAGHPLLDKFTKKTNDDIWNWCAIPDQEIWQQLPPKASEWIKDDNIGRFFLAMLKREYFLYNNAYQFLQPEISAL